MDESNSSCYEINAVIGKCADEIGLVAIGHHKAKKQRLAIKRLNLDALNGDITDFETDVILSRLFRHENIINYLASFVCGTELWLLMPLMGYGSTLDLINAHFPNGLPELAISHVMRGVLCGLNYIHQNGYVLRTIKASHILVSSSGQIKLTGLRYSCSLLLRNYKWETSHDFPKNSLKNLLWLSPEVLKQNLQGYDCKSDVYSLGITCFELARGKPPFMGIPTTLMLLEKVQGIVPSLTEEPVNNSNFYSSQEASREFSDSFTQFYELCLVYDPFERPNTSNLLTHTFIKFGKKSNTSLTDLLMPIIPFEEDLTSQTTISEHFTGSVDVINAEFNGLTIFDGYSWSFD